MIQMNDLHSVIICVVSRSTPTKFLMVKHKERGWEFPGGKIQANEELDAAAIRELYEETHLSLQMGKYSDILIPGCRVFLSYCESTTEHIEWNSKDPIIELVRWMTVIPDNLAWPREEFEEILEYFEVEIEGE